MRTRLFIRPGSRAATATSCWWGNKKPRARRGFRGSPAAHLCGGDDVFHFRERLGLDLADALGRDLELGCELVQRRRVLFPQPARFDDAPAARVATRPPGPQAPGPPSFIPLPRSGLRRARRPPARGVM